MFTDPDGVIYLDVDSIQWFHSAQDSQKTWGGNLAPSILTVLNCYNQASIRVCETVEEVMEIIQRPDGLE